MSSRADRYLVIVSICLFWSFRITAQEYFNNRYEYFGLPDVAWNVVQTDSGYMTFGVVDNDSTLMSTIGVMHVDSFGSELWKKPYGESGWNYYSGGAGSLIQLVNGEYAMAGSKDSSGIINYGLLYRFNSNGDTLWTRAYGDSLYWNTLIQCKQSLDSGFIMIGRKRDLSSSDNGDFWLIKTDSLGNIEWDTIYGGQYDDYGLSVDVCNDGGYILAGETRSYGVNSGPFSNNATNKYIIKVDSLGVMEWDTVIGNEYTDCLWNIEQTMDGGYVAGGCVVYDDMVDLARPNLIKLDNLGNIEWNKTYGEIRFLTTLYMVHELPDGSFISAGQVHDPFGGHGMGLIIKTAANGDSLWYRTYENLSGAMSFNHFRDIKPTTDAGFIATGYVWPGDPSDTGSQDIWIVKMDSMGCEVENCFVGVEEMKIPDVEMIIYPNPFNFEATVLFDKLNIDAQLTIYDVTGRLVGGYTISKNQKSLTLTAKEIGTGIFFLRLGNEHLTLNSQKVIIAR